LRGKASILVDNPKAYCEEEEDDYIIISEVEILEWSNDLTPAPSLTEEAFYESLSTCLELIASDIQQQIGFEKLNPSMPFSFDLQVPGFQDKQLLVLGMDAILESEDPNSAAKELLQQNITQSSAMEDAMANAQKQMQSMQIPGMENFQMPNMEDLMQNVMSNIATMMEDSDESWEIIKSENAETTPEQQKSLALGAIMKVARSESVNTMESGTNSLSDIVAGIKMQWDISDRESAVTTLNWLKEEGHRVIYENVKKLMANNPWYNMEEAIFKQIPEMMNAEDEDTAQDAVYKTISFYRNIKEGFRYFKSEGYLEGDYPESIAAWDFGRLINVACWSFECGYITNVEAWDYINFAMTGSGKAYKSWNEYGNTYLFGRYVWSGEDLTTDPMREIVDLLLIDENSPWIEFPL
jgi:hypothetical protein